MIESGLGIWAIAVPAALFALLAIAEYWAPRRKLALGRYPRWITHGIFFLCNAAIGRLLSLIIVVGSAATWAETSGFGLLQMTSWPIWVEAIAAFVILDFAVWFQHFVMHKHPLLWRMHKVHHSDRDLDASSALRFHPFELILSTLYKSLWVALLGVPVMVALIFELWLNANALFNHSNIRLPKWLDRLLRPILVTPDMHFVHHSIVIGEQNRNFGFALSIWDRLFGVYLPESAGGQDQQIVGLQEAQNNSPGRALWSLLLPLR
ncbi:sterol desaturase family protein [Sphingorhabdus arenilitoris]|uniref:Sterol desaturase family protein n=1 Tax=Sphingorhabdus arenilitoris TaxID=1490041 RepID=A0ABV8REG4_9SPHN